ncbi:MAG: RcnB family protein [Pseudomonadota bacterium]
MENRQIRRDAYRDGYRDARRNGYRYHDYRYHQPRRVYHSRPRHYRPYYSRPHRSRVIYGRYHRPQYRYTPRYRIGGFYGYHRNTIVIRDYWSYGLYDPPHGYHWVRDHDTGDAILASVATGAIIGLIIGALSY